MKNSKYEQESVPFFMKLSVIDKHILDEISSGLEMSHSDVMRLSLWNYVNCQKDGLLNATIKELAMTREKSFKMDMLKELERINNRQIFFIDGFRTMLDTYHTKYAPIEGVRRYVTIKLIALYSLFSDSKQRKNYVDYIRKHYLHYYSNEKKWLFKQINIIRSLKRNEKDKLLLKLQKELPYDKRAMPQVHGVERSSRMRSDKKDAVPEMPSERAKAENAEN